MNPQIRYAATCLVLAALLVGACNHELSPPPDTGNGSAAAGGRGGGPGGQGGNTSCLTGADACVRSCATTFSTDAFQPYCNAIGAFACPAGSVALSTCPADACAQPSLPCCDETTGHGVPVICGADGLKQGCPAGTRAYDAQLGCIPSGLPTTTCDDLDGKPCGDANQECHFGVTICSCQLLSDDTALTWHCSSTLIQ